MDGAPGGGSSFEPTEVGRGGSVGRCGGGKGAQCLAGVVEQGAGSQGGRAGMKTVSVRFVVNDNDAAWVEREIEKMMEHELQDAPMFSFESRDANKAEVKWRKRYDEEAKGESETPEGCLEVDE